MSNLEDLTISGHTVAASQNSVAGFLDAMHFDLVTIRS